MPVLNVTSFWLFAIATSIFSALNERELRQRRADLQALVDVGAKLDDRRGPDPPGRASSSTVVVRPVRLRARRAARRVRRARRRARDPRDGRSADDHERARLDRHRAPGSAARSCRSSASTPTRDPFLADLLPGARNVLVAPMIADGRTDRRHRRRAPAPAAGRASSGGVAAVVGQFAADRGPEPAQCRAAPARPGPRRARLADRRGQPADVPADPRAGARRHDGRPAGRTRSPRSCSSTSTTSRSSTTRSATRAGDALLVAVDRADRGPRPRGRPRRPPRRRRVRDPHRGRAGPRAAPASWPSAWSTSCGRRTDRRRARRRSRVEHRASPAPATRRDGAADLRPQRRRRDVHGQGQRQGRLRDLRPGHARARSASATSSSVELQRAVELGQLAPSTTSRSSTSRPAAIAGVEALVRWHHPSAA